MSIAKRFAVAGALLAVLGLDCAPAWAQFASAIEGTVTDPSGGVVPGATVTITNEATGVTQTGQTTSAGYYRFPALPGGVYTVKVSLQGFKGWLREHLRLESTQTRAVNVALEVGSSTGEEVTVTADAPLVETSQARVSALIEGDQIKDLPLVGRNFFNLVVLTPGVTGRVTGGTQSYAQSNADLYNNEFGVGMNANGARTESNNFMVDSGTVSSSQRNGVANINPNAESVEEVRVLANNFSAEYGRNGSVLVNVITKSGANQYRGSVGAYYTNDSMQAKNFFQKQQVGFNHPEFARKELSWGFGGPLRKDKTFFFVSGDVLRSDVAISGPRSILTPDFIRFMQQARPNNISTGIARDFPASFSPDRDFRTAGQILGSGCSGATLIDSPIGPVPCNLAVTGVGTWNATSPRNGFQWSARLDHNFNGGKVRLYASVIRTTTRKVGNPGNPIPEVYPGFTGDGPTSSLQVNTNYTKVLSSNLVNEMQFSWVRPYGELMNPHPDIPGVTVTGIVGYQLGWGPNQFVQNSFNFSDVVTWTRGAHSLKFGGGYTREHADNDSGRAATRPTFNFDSVFDFAADRPSVEGQIAIDPRTAQPVTSIKRLHRTQSLSAFAHDEWKLTPNFTLSMGLRYEGFLNIYDASDDIMSNLEFTSDTGNLRNDLATARMVQRKYYLDGGLFGGGQHTLAPRLSFAWDPTRTGQMSIRGGVGRFYERMSNQIWDGEHTNLPGIGFASLTIFQAVRPLFSLGTAQEPPYGYTYPSGLTAGVNQYGGLVNGTAGVNVVDGDIGNMHLDNWFLGVQRGIGRYMVVEANYIGSRGRSMYVKRDINRYTGDLLDGRLDRILPGFSSIAYTDASDVSHYNGLAFGLKVNRSDLNLGIAYTLGKAIDRSSSATPPQRPDAHGPADQDEGLSDFDVRHKIAVSLNYRLPGPSAGAARAILGGWQLAGVLIKQSGTPYSVVCNRGFIPVRNAAGVIVGNTGCDYNADGTNLDRPNVPAFGDSKSGSNDDFVNGIFRAADFPTPALGQPGNLGRNTFIGPGYFNVDLALVKSFRVTRADVQLRLESFNVFDTVNLFNPVSNLADPLFGRSTSALPGRIFQVSARLAF
jgi:hypothetical protein